MTIAAAIHRRNSSGPRRGKLITPWHRQHAELLLTRMRRHLVTKLLNWRKLRVSTRNQIAVKFATKDTAVAQEDVIAHDRTHWPRPNKLEKGRERRQRNGPNKLSSSAAGSCSNRNPDEWELFLRDAHGAKHCHNWEHCAQIKQIIFVMCHGFTDSYETSIHEIETLCHQNPYSQRYTSTRLIPNKSEGGEGGIGGVAA